MSVDDLVVKKEKEAPVGQFTEAEAAKKAEPEKDKPMPMLTKIVGLGALIAGAVWFLKRKGKGHPPGDPGIAI